ncbi:MAG: hypothetical protein ACUVV0_11480 [Anaerolineae bacterium]
MVQKIKLDENHTFLNKVRLGSELIIIEREGQPLAAIIPIEQYRKFVAWQEEQAVKPQQLAALERESETFQRLHDQLLETYKGQFVAIIGDQVVDSDFDNCELARRVYARFGYIPVYIQKVEEAPTIYEIPSPEVIS